MLHKNTEQEIDLARAIKQEACMIKQQTSYNVYQNREILRTIITVSATFKVQRGKISVHWDIINSLPHTAMHHSNYYRTVIDIQVNMMEIQQYPNAIQILNVQGPFELLLLLARLLLFLLLK